MSVFYCGLLAKKDMILVGESNTGISYFIRLQTYFRDMTKGEATGKVIMDKDNTIHYIRATNIIFVVITATNIAEDKPSKVMEYFVDIVLREFKSFENVTTVTGKLTKYQHQQKLVEPLNTLVKSFETIYDKKKVQGIQLEIDETKKYLKQGIKKAIQNNEDLGELLIVSEQMEKEADRYRANTKELEDKTRCIKPWMIIVGIVLVIIIAYIVVALVRCSSPYKVWC